LAASLTITLIVGCSSDDSSDSIATLDPLSPSEIVSRSSDALADITTFRFALSHDGGNTILTNGIEVQEASGTAVAPGSYTLDADTLVAGFFVNSQIVVIDHDSYMTHPVTHRWQLLEPDVSPFRTFNPVSLVASILEQVQDLTPAPPGSAQEGVYVIGGKLPAIALVALTGGVDETAPPLNVLVTVDGTSLFPVEARITGRATSAESGELVRTVRLFEFNSDIVVEPPI
jgi:hypothetical protein